MKKLSKLSFLLLLLCSLCFGQRTSSLNFSTAVVATSAAINVTGNGTMTHHLVWTGNGTISTCVVSVESSADGFTFTAGGVIPNQTCTSNGSITFNSLPTNWIRINVTTLSGGGTLNVSYFGLGFNNSDPCASPYVTKSRTQNTITTATTTQLIPPVSGATVYLCGYTWTAIGTTAAETIQFTTGTGATCGTGTGQMTPVLTSGVVGTNPAFHQEVGFGGATVTTGNANAGVCVVSTVGTGPSITILTSYVQQVPAP